MVVHTNNIISCFLYFFYNNIFNSAPFVFNRNIKIQFPKHGNDFNFRISASFSVIFSETKYIHVTNVRRFAHIRYMTKSIIIPKIFQFPERVCPRGACQVPAHLSITINTCYAFFLQNRITRINYVDLARHPMPCARPLIFLALLWFVYGILLFDTQTSPL